MGRKGRQEKGTRETGAHAQGAQEQAAGPRFNRSRRGLLAGLAGGLGLFAGETVLAARPALADNGQPLTLGQSNSASAMTILKGASDTSYDAVLYVEGISGNTRGIVLTSAGGGPGLAVTAVGTGIKSAAIDGPGIYTDTSQLGSPYAAEGIYAQSGIAAGTSPGATHNGVHGVTNSPSDSGVWGEAVGGGYGVSGSTTSTGIGGPAGVWGANLGSGPGVKGTSTGGAAVYGQSSTEGLYAQSGTTAGTVPGGTHVGVHAVTDSQFQGAVWGEAVAGGHGVFGSTNSPASNGNAGVYGSNKGNGPGVLGASSGGPAVQGVTSSGGVGVLAEDSAGTGVALQVAGRAVFSRAGHGLISGTSTSATVYPPGGLTGTSTVLAILQTALPGVWVTSAVPQHLERDGDDQPEPGTRSGEDRLLRLVRRQLSFANPGSARCGRLCP